MSPESLLLKTLRDGELEILDPLPQASNATFRAVVDGTPCVYKPIRGERPLWDFPDGTLAGREVAAFLVAQAAGWSFVPPTVLRDGPYGPGACMAWVDGAPDLASLGLAAPADELVVATGAGPVVLSHADDPTLALIAAFDALVNNADRKGGHLLRTASGLVFGLDHGLCFHTEPKLRTVLWGWAGSPLSEGALAGLEQLQAALPDLELAQWLAADEIGALHKRVEELLGAGVFPRPRQDGPALPWPPI